MDHTQSSMSNGSDAQQVSSTSTPDNSHATMAMVFQWVLETPIYSYSFTPKTSSQYFGALLFLVLLSIIYRAFVAFKSHKETQWAHQEQLRKGILAGQFHDEKASADGSTREIRGPAPWNWRVDPARASLSVLNIALHYLLMFAVMSLNVGYFFAVLIGVFLGDLLFARYGH
ncbi:hypothetical protein TWF694_010690 [Orbilia ellipsospora]|uniref:Copper transport protein n=1 Tax=Orbilia ellipsospora TaxID=2528407 RepID=A0AAV9X6R3_9PEZI